MPPAQKTENVDWVKVVSGQTHHQPLDMKTNESVKEPATSTVPLIDQTFPIQLVWRNIVLFVYLHGAALYGMYLLLTGHIMIQTVIWGFLLFVMSGLGITAGCHRLWSHKSYKANLPLRILLGIFQTMAFQVRL
jgi:fatty-acid desaturase